MKPSLSEYIALRKRLGNVNEVAAKLGITSAALYYRERGDSKIRREHVLAMVELAREELIGNYEEDEA